MLPLIVNITEVDANGSTLESTTEPHLSPSLQGNETRLLRSSSGEDLGAWNCGIDYGAAGKPFGVRMYGSKLLFVAIMNNPQVIRTDPIH